MSRSLCSLVLLLLPACAEVDETGAKALWDEIHAEDYRSWQRAPGYDQPRPTVSAHGDTAVVFVDQVVADALERTGLEAWPDGSTIVKDIYDDGDLSLIAAMKKQGQSWFFAEWETDGEPDYAGRDLDTCTDCHRRSNDRVEAFSLP